MVTWRQPGWAPAPKVAHCGRVRVAAIIGGGATVGAGAAAAGVGVPAGAATALVVGPRVAASGVGVCHAAGVAVALVATPGDPQPQTHA